LEAPAAHPSGSGSEVGAISGRRTHTQGGARAYDHSGNRRMRSVLRRLLAGELSEAEAEAELRRVQLEELAGRARLDVGRGGRRGLPEVVLASGKLPEEAARLAVALAGELGQGLVSRLGPDHWRALDAQAAEAGLEVRRYHSAAAVRRPG